MNAAKRVVVEASASSANLGPGFDVFALALDAPRDRIEATVTPSKTFSVDVEVEGGPGIPSDPRRNSAAAVALSMARRRRIQGRLKFKVRKGVPIGVGLGSSGASSAAAAVAMNELFGLGMKMGELVYHAGAGERAASGAAHLDNVAASIAGGFVLVPSKPGADPLTLEPPVRLSVIVVTPRVNLPGRKTAYARSLLPRKVGLEAAVRNVANASLMVAGFASGDIKTIGEGMEDAIVEPARLKMVPGFSVVKAAAIGSGASGFCISGAGPSVLALADRTKANPKKILESMVEAFRKKGLAATGFITKPGKGARVIEGP